MGLSLSFDDGTPPYHIPFGTTPESLDYLDIMLMMQSMQSSNTNISYTHTINVFRGSNASLDIWMSEDMINFMMASGGSTSELGLTFNVSYIDGETIVEGANVLPIEFLSCHESSYVVSAESNNPEYGRVNGEILYEEEIDYGSNCTLTATANEGCTFVNWTENGEEVSTEAVYSFNVYSNRNLVANFSLNNYEITASANPVVGGSITGAGNYDYGTQCTLIAIPNEGYVFNAWTENGETVSTDAAYGFLVTDNRTLVANFAGHNSVGKLNGVFTASENSHIQFSQGNLQYQASTNTWSFASNQWDIVGDNNANISEIYNGWIDLFGWGTSGYDHGANAYQPWSTSTDYSDYYAYGAYNYTLFYGSRQADWGYNAISNGGNAENIGWRTPMYNEWYYVFNTRSTTSGVRYAKAQVEGVNGVILLPDDWSTGYFSLSNTNSSEVGYSSNVITASDWENCLQAHGAVFLPAAGHRNGTSVGNVGSNGSYWSSEVFRQDLAALLIFSDGGLFNGNAALRYLGSSVRLVCTASFNVNAVPSLAEGGVVSGDGIYQEGVTCSLTAMASEGYAFSAWTENGETVSNDAVYSFTVTSDRNIVAVFLPIYVIAAEANNADYGSVTGDGTFMEGETCALTASPNEGYSFVTWIEDGEPVSTDAIYSFSVTNDRNLVAVFLPTYVITAEANNADYGTVTGGGTYVVNVTCTVTATPAEGYEFVNWTENGEVVSTEAEYAFTVTGDRSLVANFVLKNYDILATANPNEGGTASGAGNYNHFETCTLVATANWGYTFINWTLDGNVVSTEPSYTFTVTSAGDYTANFQLNNYAINAFANPSEGGSVSGAGNYDHGTECTLTATANVGYTFVNWTLDGIEVGTDPTYTFTVYEEATYVANFSLNLYEITAIANPVEGGTITGAGNYYHGDECILKAIPIENYTFLYWTENGNYLSSDAIYSFVATSDRSLVAVFAGNEQTISLSPGWTWLSSYIEMEGIDGLGMLENGLDPNGVMIKSQRDGFVSYAGGMWIGTLDGISNEKMYLVNTNEASDVTFTGPVANMMNHPITLNPNWTWLGYPVPFAVDINDALANLNASEGDVVKTQSNFATYSTNDGWSGSLNQLTPGMGLMYQSHNSQPVTFNYGVGMSRALKANVTAEHNHWVPDIHAYPNNMSVMAVVELNGEELQDEGYELAVFNGSECRGSARLAYVPSLHRYVAFLTVTGEDDVELYLALYDTMTGKAYYNTTDCPNFEANAVLGSLSMPFVARFGGTTDVDEWDAPNIELYPNPVVAGHLFQMEMPAECQGARVSIVNALGAVISTTDVYDEPITLRAPAVPGVYTVRIVTDKQGTFTRKLIVNK